MARRNPFREIRARHSGKRICCGYSQEAINESIMKGFDLPDCAPHPDVVCLHGGPDPR